MSLSHGPHPPGTLVENKGQTQIRPSGDRSVDAFFLRFHGSNSSQFQLLFSSFTVRSAEGYKFLKLRGAKPGSPTSQVFGLAGWNFAAPQTVILNERCNRE
jgi:hypothetical protein